MKKVLLIIEKTLAWIGAFLLFPLLFVVYMQDSIIVQREYDLNVSQTAFKIQKSTIRRVTDESQMLRQANECLIKYSYRDRCITAIKHTPLPKLEME